MKKKVATLVAMVLLSMSFISCGVDDIDISKYKDEEILLIGLTDKKESITIEELKSLDCVTEETESTSDKIGTVKATGPLLSTVVESFGSNLSDYSQVKIYGEDDYDITLKKDFVQENPIIIAFGVDGEPLGEDSRPVRIIIPESDSAYWVRMVNKIEFIE